MTMQIVKNSTQGFGQTGYIYIYIYIYIEIFDIASLNYL